MGRKINNGKILNTNDFSAFDDKNKERNDGVFKLQLTSWSEFHNVVKIFNNNTDYIWRGQRCYPEEYDNETKDRWILKSSFDRDLDRGMLEARQKELKGRLITFKKRLEDLPNTYNIDFAKEDEIWAIGQHHGLRTPLLDWTQSPYIASYFACYENGKEQTKDRVVYALNRVVKRLIIKEKNSRTKEVLSKQRKIEFDFDSSHFSPEHHMRFIKQKGAFTKTYNGNDIKSVVQEFWRKKKDYKTEIILAEILIPDIFCDECLSSLQSMNITHGVLFPDYAGAVYICKSDLGSGDKNETHQNPEKV